MVEAGVFTTVYQIICYFFTNLIHYAKSPENWDLVSVNCMSPNKKSWPQFVKSMAFEEDNWYNQLNWTLKTSVHQHPLFVDLYNSTEICMKISLNLFCCRDILTLTNLIESFPFISSIIFSVLIRIVTVSLVWSVAGQGRATDACLDPVRSSWPGVIWLLDMQWHMISGCWTAQFGHISEQHDGIGQNAWRNVVIKWESLLT